jgi:hypothetical protein
VVVVAVFVVIVAVFVVVVAIRVNCSGARHGMLLAERGAVPRLVHLMRGARRRMRGALSGMVGVGSGRLVGARLGVIRAELSPVLFVASDATSAQEWVALAPRRAVLGAIHHLVGAGLRMGRAEGGALGFGCGDLIGARFGMRGTECSAVLGRIRDAVRTQIRMLLTPVRPDRRLIVSEGKRRQEAQQSDGGEQKNTETHECLAPGEDGRGRPCS